MNDLAEYFKKCNMSMASFCQHIKESLCVEVREYPEEGLYVFNYAQGESPKTNSVVRACRGSILDENGEVVCPSFWRFFNYGEVEKDTQAFDIKSADFYEKADGSFIKIYNYKGRWFIGSRGTAFGETISSFGLSWQDLVLKVLGLRSMKDFQDVMAGVDSNVCFYFELIGVLNIHVTQYKANHLVLLGMTTGDQKQQICHDTPECFSGFSSVRLPRKYTFDHHVDVKEALDSLENLEEGFVGHCTKSGVFLKFKSKAYMAAHYMRGNGKFSEKKIVNMILEKEIDEFLLYFPHYEDTLKPYINTCQRMEEGLKSLYNDLLNFKGDLRERHCRYGDHPAFPVVNRAALKKVDVLPYFVEKALPKAKMRVYDYYANEDQDK